MTTSQWLMTSPIGPLYLSASERGLESLTYRPLSLPFLADLAGADVAVQTLANAVTQLHEYFARRRQTFDLPLHCLGTAFQKQVWQELAKIPYGTTFAYRDIAQRVNRAKAVRAVGSANGKNPLSIIIPCHRVIAADGTLGGYGGGLVAKKALLALEQGHRS